MNEVDAKRVINEQGIAFGAVLVAEFVPEEAELYPELIAAYQTHTKEAKDHPLGMGLGEIVSAASPYFFEVGGAVVAGIWAVAEGTTEKSIHEAVTSKITAWIKRKFANPPPLALTDRQIEAIMDTVETKVGRMRMPAETKQKVIAAIRSSLSGPAPDKCHGG